ncbi:MAG TPA: STAS domain-containing protein [Solirubrobacteraceae bacterium]|nr:STAS domain-containing protein [Solirubrobacteraceae bacterium]
MQSHFRVEARSQGQAYVLAVSGELDLAAASSLEEELDRALASDSQVIVVDLKDLDFIDSTGLSVLVRAHQRAQESELQMGLVNPGTQVERLLSLTGLAQRLTLDQSVQDQLSEAGS